MADSDRNIKKHEGKSWRQYAEHMDISLPSSSHEDDETVKAQRVSSSTRLKKEEMHIFGHCPRSEEFVLVVCRICGNGCKPQFLAQHIALRHNGPKDECKEDMSAATKVSHKSHKSKRSKSSGKPRKKVNVSELYEDSLVSLNSDVHSELSKKVSGDLKSSLYSPQMCNSSFTSTNDGRKNCLSRNFLSMKPELDPVLKFNLKGETIEKISDQVPQSYLAPTVQTESNHYQPSPSPSNMQQMTQSVHPMATTVPQGLTSPMLGTSPLTPNLGPSTPGMGRPTTPGMGHPQTPGLGRPVTPGLGRPSTPGMGPPTPLMAPLTPGMGPPTPGLCGVPSVGMCSMVPTPSPNMSHQVPSPAPMPSVSPYAQTPSPAQQISQNYHQNSNMFQGGSGHQQLYQLVQGPTQNTHQSTSMGNLLQNVDSSQQNLVGSNYGDATQGLTLTQNPNFGISTQIQGSCVPPVARKSEEMIEEEEVNRISAMLMRETESMMMAPQSMMAPQTIVEAQGLAGGGITNVSSVTNTGQQSSVPVNNLISMQTIKQLQNELLATVSESDLNAVLNSTPETQNTDVVQNANHIQFSGTPVSTGSQFSTQNNIYTDQSLNIPLPAFDEIAKEILLEGGQPQASNIQQKTYITQDSSNNSSVLFNLEKGTDSDELARAVDSILWPNNNGNSFSVLSGPIETSTQGNNSTEDYTQPNSSLNRSSSTPGITVVFGDPNQTSQSITLNSSRKIMPGTVHAQVMAQDNTTSSIVHRNSTGELLQKEVRTLSQDQPEEDKSNVHSQLLQTKVQSVQVSSQMQVLPQHKFGQSSPVASFSNSSGSTVAPVLSTTAKRPNKRRKNERKCIPLNERKYDPENHCGVMDSQTGKQCTRSLTCKSHSLTLRRNVQGRSKKFDELLNEHKNSKGTLQQRSVKPTDNSSTIFQGASPRTPVVINNNMTYTSQFGSTPILVKTLSGSSSASCVTIPSPSYMQHSESSNSVTASSPVLNSGSSYSSHSQSTDSFHFSEPPKPLAVCRYNGRRFGGQFVTDHKSDLLRNSFRSCIKRPSLDSLLSDNSVSPSLSYAVDRTNTVKPLLARKLQASVPVSCSKDLLGTTVNYNGHIQLSNNSINVVNNSTLNATLKRQSNMEFKNKHKNKRLKTNDGINYVSNVVQLDPNSNKSQFPVVVSLPNGITSQQTITIGNMMTGVRNNQPIRLHPSLTVKDGQNVESRSIGDNIVLGSSLSGTNFVITESVKSLKPDVGSSLRIEGNKIITTSKGNSSSNNAGASINLVGSSGNLAGGTNTVLTQAVPHQGQYILTTMPGNGSAQFIQQIRNCRMGRTSGVKLLGTNQGTMTGGRQAFVLQQEKEAS